MARRGRSNRDMLARMSRILLLLRTNPAGLTTDQLLDRVGYGTASRPSRMRTLNRDLAALAADGWRIETMETANTPALRRLRTVDNRFATGFTASEREQLARAALCAGPDIADALACDLGRAAGPPVFVMAPGDGRGRLGVCQSAAADRCTLHFTYNGRARQAHPVGVVLRPAGWYLQALDSGDGVVKHFAIDRMRHLSKDVPGSARALLPQAPPPVWDFMRRLEHDPMTVTVDTPDEHLPDVVAALGVNGHEVRPAPDPGMVRVDVTVTNTDALLVRLLELGRRVTLVGPESVRGRLRDRLLSIAGA